MHDATREGPVPQQKNLQVLLRFVGGLDLLKRLLPGVLLLIVLASSTPQVFLWTIGEYVKCTERACKAQVFGKDVPITLLGLALIALAGMIFRIAAWAVFEVAGVWSTSRLHDKMIAALARARTTYFDETPSGHLINRIVGDFDNLRFMGVIRIGDATNAFVEVLATMVLVLLVNPWPALAIVPITVAYIKVQLDIGPMLGHSEEIASQWRGEVVHRETDMIEGSRIFALYGKQHALLSSLRKAYERFTDARLMSAKLQAWSRAWMRVLAAIYGCIVFIFLTLGVQSGRISLTLAAVIVSALFALSGSFGWLTWCLSYLTETLGNARRVYELIDLPREEDEEHGTPRALPTASPVLRPGDVTFHDFSMAYKPGTPAVLRGVDLTIEAGSRTGVIGRTGAGKSSLVQALFRMVHVLEGDVRIGGTSIYDVDVNELRALFGVVPQNPYLFKGTVRDNLDRYKTASDAAVKRTLEVVELALTPEQAIDEGGRNLSLGERQLLCLARVLLAGKPYVIMDEPTSSVDMVTDAKIQRLLFEELSGRTVITIAHRLESLARYDKIVQMGEGKVVRVGTPADFF